MWWIGLILVLIGEEKEGRKDNWVTRTWWDGSLSYELKTSKMTKSCVYYHLPILFCFLCLLPARSKHSGVYLSVEENGWLAGFMTQVRYTRGCKHNDTDVMSLVSSSIRPP